MIIMLSFFSLSAEEQLLKQAEVGRLAAISAETVFLSNKEMVPDQ